MPTRSLRQTGDFIAGHQLSNGQIPWFRGHFADPWDHVEAAMALGVVGRIEESRAGLDWLAATQHPDGSWPMATIEDRVSEPTIDTNQCAYVAVGLWHDHLLTGDTGHLRTHWDLLERAIDLVVSAQLPTGAIAWARAPSGEWWDQGLLTGSSCLVLSLGCALEVATRLGHDRPAWARARAKLATAVREATPGDGVFMDKPTHSMDWFYPVLGGAVVGDAAHAHIDRRWTEFVVPGYGIRCVADRPWATAAESSELAIALDILGRRDAARSILADVAVHRDSDGGYWTGYVWPDEAIWPEEKTTWTAAAVILATDALGELTPAHRLFRDRARVTHTPGARVVATAASR
ncbi:MAG: prenyltransferase [Dermatophilaceae bacterium]|nr:prenyltransferase [Intrasporangiaceae bacterium]